jgi:hypothetical protein
VAVLLTWLILLVALREAVLLAVLVFPAAPISLVVVVVATQATVGTGRRVLAVVAVLAHQVR